MVNQLEHVVVHENNSDEFNIGHCKNNTNCHVLFLTFDARSEDMIKYMCSSDNNIQN